jgi:hypothetical protein
MATPRRKAVKSARKAVKSLKKDRRTYIRKGTSIKSKKGRKEAVKEERHEPRIYLQHAKNLRKLRRFVREIVKEKYMELPCLKTKREH